jgi:PTH1 family peptidyl-tRNA hydrolase
MAEPVTLIVGLGNPGPRYAETRHNAGFWFIDRLAAMERATFRPESKFHGQVCRLPRGDCWLLKPDTFMNRSGLAAISLMRFYKIPPQRVLVAHDELDLPPGTVRLKRGGGHGGHNGLRDLLAHLGSAEFLRLRLGIGHPGHKDAVVDYVLHEARAEEQQIIDQAIEASLGVVALIVSGDLDKAMNLLHRKSP